MSDISNSVSDQDRPLLNILIEFYETMKGLERDPERSGKQATKLVMTINDINNLK